MFDFEKIKSTGAKDASELKEESQLEIIKAVTEMLDNTNKGVAGAPFVSCAVHDAVSLLASRRSALAEAAKVPEGTSTSSA